MGHEAAAAAALGVYKPRRPQASPLFRLVSDHVQRLQTVYDARFAREYLLTFSCKCRYFWPSCHAKRLAIWAQWLDTTLLAPVPPQLAIDHDQASQRRQGIGLMEIAVQVGQSTERHLRVAGAVDPIIGG